MLREDIIRYWAIYGSGKRYLFAQLYVFFFCNSTSCFL